MQVGDTVRVVDGPHASAHATGQIKHIFRTYVFLFSRTHPDNGGIFVCRARHLLLAGAQTAAAGQAGAGSLFEMFVL